VSDNTGIEWTDATWNPTKGCDRVSPGCDHCYAMTLAPRLKAMGSPAYQLDGDPRTSGPGFLAHEWQAVLDQPLRWTRPRRIFVNSMSDLFHDRISDEYIARVFAVMSLAPQHTFQVLTKRHARMRSLLGSDQFETGMRCHARALKYGDGNSNPRMDDRNYQTWPLPNVWLGVSVEDQRWANIRIPALLDTPAAVRFLSCEPMLGPVDLSGPLSWSPYRLSNDIDWVITGGESGRGARPMHPDWARSLRDQCVAAGVPFLFKQWGEWAPAAQVAGRRVPDDADLMQRVGKKRAGRELDGRTWDEYPTAVAA
jgi:protein gp37